MSCVTREIVLPVPRERAWELVTDEAELREWLADEVEFEAEEGAPLRFDDREGVVEHVEAGERIEFTWEDSRVVVAARGPRSRHTVRRDRGAPRHGVGPQAHRAGVGRRAVSGLNEVFGALADPTRREVLRSLAEQPGLTASRLAGELPMTRQAVAKHLHALSGAGLVTARREGRETRYTLTPAPLAEAIDWMTAVGAEWDERLARLARRSAL